MDLTDEEKDKLKGSVKVAKKLEKLENIGQERNFSDSEDEVEYPDQDYTSLDSLPSDNSLNGLSSMTVLSPKNSGPPSLTESMQLMDELLSNKSMDYMLKLDKLEAILSAATLLPNDQIIGDNNSDEGLIMKDFKAK